MSTQAGAGRRYPERPIVGVGAIIVAEDGTVVLVRRRNEPLAGRWSLPGGAVELGETLAASVAREVLEETGLEVTVGPVVDVVDRIHQDAAGGVAYHYVLVDYLCRAVAGVLHAGSDASEVASVNAAALAEYGLAPDTVQVIRRALAMAR